MKNLGIEQKISEFARILAKSITQFPESKSLVVKNSIAIEKTSRLTK